MKVKLTQDTRVNFPKGTIVDVPKQEAERLLAFGLCEVQKEKQNKKKKG